MCFKIHFRTYSSLKGASYLAQEIHCKLRVLNACIKLFYIPGITNIQADHLSRRPITTEDATALKVVEEIITKDLINRKGYALDILDLCATKENSKAKWVRVQKPNMKAIIHFLHTAKETGNSLNLSKSAIFSAYRLSNMKLPEELTNTVENLLKDKARKRGTSIQPEPTIWNVKDLLDYIRTDEDSNVQTVIKRTLTLVAITSGNRVSEIHQMKINKMKNHALSAQRISKLINQYIAEDGITTRTYNTSKAVASAAAWANMRVPDIVKAI
uniref:Tyr recombinase domain-containing protein n=1 Tax=Strongyloides venezuelensis TaxID=75913 RepID=A0A0K0FTE4_STRVS